MSILTFITNSVSYEIHGEMIALCLAFREAMEMEEG